MTASHLWPTPEPEFPVPSLAAIEQAIDRFSAGSMQEWERHYLQFHRRRFQDTLRLLPEGNGGHLLDVGAFPGHLSALARERGWRVTGLNNGIECGGSYDDFVARCASAGIDILSCEVEEEPFPLPTGSVDAVLLCELFEHLYRNPFHVLKQIFRVLRPGGLLLLTTPNLRCWETFLRLLHGWGSQAPVSRPFLELMPSLLYHRHNREYTAGELSYFLSLQGKDLYDFDSEPVFHSSCYDGPADIPRITGRGMGRFASTVHAALAPRTPSLRKQLMVRARRGPQGLVEWASLGNPEGFGEPREDLIPVQGFTRRLTFPFRTTGPTAAFDLPVPPGRGPLLVTLLLAHPPADGAPPLSMTWSAGGWRLLDAELSPSLRPVRLRLVLPEESVSGGSVRLSCSSTTWENPELCIRTGPLVGGEWILLQRLDSPATVADAYRRLLEENRAEEGHPPILRLSQSLVLLAGGGTRDLAIGPDDQSCLGEGWHALERRRGGWFRWSGPSSTVHLAATGKETRAFARIDAGDRRLGPVTGELVASRRRPGEPDAAVISAPFCLAAGGKGTVSAPLPPGAGEVLLTLAVAPPRRPCDLIPGSPDTRPLGVAVSRVWLS
jgi:SAM-dependent methyltransferase